MTCIVGVACDDSVYIGSDSCTSWGGLQDVAEWPKVWHVGGQLGTPLMVMGFCGAHHIPEVLRHAWTPPERVSADLDAYAFAVVQSWRAALRESGQLGTVDGRDQMDGAALLAMADRLFFVSSDFHATEHRSGYMAIGSGEEVAIGAMWTLRLQPIGGREKVRAALRAAAAHAHGVRPPFTIATLSSDASGWFVTMAEDDA